MGRPRVFLWAVPHVSQHDIFSGKIPGHSREERTLGDAALNRLHCDDISDKSTTLAPSSISWLERSQGAASEEPGRNTGTPLFQMGISA